MATIRRRNNKWNIQIRKDGKALSKTFSLKSDAIKWGKEIELSIEQSTFIDYGTNKVKLSELLDRYEEEVVGGLKSHNSDKCRIREL
jgi:hypothetical protein